MIQSCSTEEHRGGRRTGRRLPFPIVNTPATPAAPHAKVIHLAAGHVLWLAFLTGAPLQTNWLYPHGACHIRAYRRKELPMGDWC